MRWAEEYVMMAVNGDNGKKYGKINGRKGERKKARKGREMLIMRVG